MAKIAPMCCILVLALMFAGLGPVSSLGSLTFYNLASENVTVSSDFQFKDGSEQTIVDVLVTSDIRRFDIISQDTECVETKLTKDTPAGQFWQGVYSWCPNSGLLCMPDCVWIMEDSQISWANTTTSNRTVYQGGWLPPSPPTPPPSPAIGAKGGVVPGLYA